VKEYFALFATQAADRGITYNPEAAVATNGSIEASTGDDEDGEGGEAWDLNEVVQDEDESGAMAQFERRAVSSSVLVALGILGVAVAL
jgi:hypothetical protein